MEFLTGCLVALRQELKRKCAPVSVYGVVRSALLLTLFFHFHNSQDMASLCCAQAGTSMCALMYTQVLGQRQMHTQPYSRETQRIQCASWVTQAHDHTHMHKHTHPNSIRSEHAHPTPAGSGSAHTSPPLSQMHTNLYISPQTQPARSTIC